MSSEDDDVLQASDDDIENSTLIPGYKGIENYVMEGYKVLTDGVKASATLPMGKNFLFYQTFTNFRDVMLDCGSEIQDLLEKILQVEGLRRNVRNCTLEDAMDAMQDMNDVTLDRSRQTMDFMDGIKGNPLLAREVAGTVVSGAWNRASAPKGSDTLSTVARGPPRPQFSFADKPDNSSLPWVPRILFKPNAQRPLAVTPLLSEDGLMSWSHPYEFELDAFEMPDEMLVKVIPTKPKPLEECRLVLVDTEESLQSMMADLQEQSIIGVDLEHHSIRSFLGFTCLIQISTFEKDYIIDAITLRSYLNVLNEVFTKPSILKVLHGADSDIGWLQRDFGVYIVGMFDTHQAAKLLSFSRLSLAYLLQNFCGVITDKRYQLYDWRIRPLPAGALEYARKDTHYLMFIYQCLTNQLIDKAAGETNLLKACFSRSTDVCRMKYSKPEICEDSFMMLYRKGKRLFDNRQLHALKGLFLWRDKVAREQDESVGYVLPNHMMLQISETLPREAQGILSCCNPVPPLVRSNLLELHYIVVSAKEQPLVKVIPETNPAPVDSAGVGVGAAEEIKALDEWAYPSVEGSALPTLLDSSETSPVSSSPPSPPDLTSPSPSLSIFKEDISLEVSGMDKEHLDEEILQRLSGMQFVTPYQRYIRVLPYALQLEKEQREREAKEAERVKQVVLLRQQQGSLINSLSVDGVVKLKREVIPPAPLKMMVAEEVANQKYKKRKISHPDEIKIEDSKEELDNSTNEFIPQENIKSAHRGRKRKSSEVDLYPEMLHPIKLKKDDQDETDNDKSITNSSKLSGGTSLKSIGGTELVDTSNHIKMENLEQQEEQTGGAAKADTGEPESVNRPKPEEETDTSTLEDSYVEDKRTPFPKDPEKQNVGKRKVLNATRISKRKKSQEKISVKEVNKRTKTKNKERSEFEAFDYSKADFSKFSSGLIIAQKMKDNGSSQKRPQDFGTKRHSFGPKGKRKADILEGLKKVGLTKKKGKKR